MFYLNHRDNKSGDRDVFNERPTREEQNIAAAVPATGKGGLSPVADSATIHTTMGDMHLRLFPAQAPKAVENFVGHARSGFFDGIIFHRVIPKFMIQTGDPLGDGTGGDSIWGREFEDELSDDLKHDRLEYFPSRWHRYFSLFYSLDHTLLAWQMLDLTLMARNFSSQPLLRPGWTRNTPFLVAYCQALKLSTPSKT